MAFFSSKLDFLVDEKKTMIIDGFKLRFYKRFNDNVQHWSSYLKLRVILNVKINFNLIKQNNILDYRVDLLLVFLRQR